MQRVWDGVGVGGGSVVMTRRTGLGLVVNGIIAFGLNVVSFTANRKMGPLTMTVAGARFLFICFSLCIFQKSDGCVSQPT